VSRSLGVAWDERLIGYDFGPGHPLAPIRVDLTIALARAFGVLDADNVSVLSVEPATDAELMLVHTSDYIDAVRRAGDTMSPDPLRGLSTSDDPLFRGMHEATSLVAGATLAAVQSVHEG